jgi:preprotein translocase subunit SecG
MYAFLTAIHIVICFALVVSVLLQAGKGGGLAGAFGGQGGGGGQAIFGGRGAATFLSKATAVLGALFLLTALMLAIIPRGTQGPARSLIQERAEQASETQPTSTPQGTQPIESALPGEGTQPPPGGAQGAQESEGDQPAPTGGGSEGGQEENSEGGG